MRRPLIVLIGLLIASSAFAQSPGLVQADDERARGVGHALALLDQCGSEFDQTEFKRIARGKLLKGYTPDQVKYLAILVEMSRRMRRDLLVDYTCDNGALDHARNQVYAWMVQSPLTQ